ncbi:hypothetical protein C8R47DRAFT_185347 [Mycena vitilis]|nr:hypothetical protein C8R47DRAFT_185347 [Mycena vitilis]
MFNKSTLFFFAFVASGAVAAPLPFPKNFARADASGCNATLVTNNIAQMQDVANQILSVGLVLPDPFRQNAADSATFDTVVSALADANTAAAGSDFATASSKIQFVVDKTRGLLTGKVADGLESSIDLKLSDLAGETAPLAAACAAPGGAASAAAAPATAAKAPAAAAPAPAVDVAAAAATCDKATIQSNIAELKDQANQILSVGLVLPDPFRQSADNSATFDTVVSAIADADTAATAGNFATVSSKIKFVADTTDTLLDGKVADGLESGVDLSLNKLAHDTEILAAACA